MENLLSHRPVSEVEHPALAFGTIIHAGVAEWWRSLDLDRVREVLTQEFLREGPRLQDDQTHTMMLAQSMLEEYAEKARAAGDHWMAEEDWEPVLIEQRLELEPSPLGRLTFQLDRLMQSAEELTLVDTKTARRLDQRWERQWRMKLQPKLYAWGVWQKFGRVPMVYIEGLQKSCPMPVRYVELAYSPSELQEAIEQLVRICQSDAELVARSLQEDGALDVNRLLWEVLVNTDTNADACWNYGRACPVLPLCSRPPEDRVEAFKLGFEYEEPTYLV